MFITLENEQKMLMNLPYWFDPSNNWHFSSNFDWKEDATRVQVQGRWQVIEDTNEEGDQSVYLSLGQLFSLYLKLKSIIPNPYKFNVQAITKSAHDLKIQSNISNRGATTFPVSLLSFKLGQDACMSPIGIDLCPLLSKDKEPDSLLSPCNKFLSCTNKGLTISPWYLQWYLLKDCIQQERFARDEDTHHMKIYSSK